MNSRDLKALRAPLLSVHRDLSRLNWFLYSTKRHYAGCWKTKVSKARSGLRLQDFHLVGAADLHQTFIWPIGYGKQFRGLGRRTGNPESVSERTGCVWATEEGFPWENGVHAEIRRMIKVRKDNREWISCAKGPKKICVVGARGREVKDEARYKASLVEVCSRVRSLIFI